MGSTPRRPLLQCYGRVHCRLAAKKEKSGLATVGQTDKGTRRHGDQAAHESARMYIGCGGGVV